MSLRLYCKYTGSYIRYSRNRSGAGKSGKSGAGAEHQLRTASQHGEKFKKERLGDQCFSTKIVLT